MVNERQASLQRLAEEDFDVLVLGGGINGAVAAAALSAQGAKVALIDRNDFASFSSSNSSNLAWGGIKYMESGEWLLVRKLCLSRNHLMEHYPSRVKEIRFFTTINKGFRWPAWAIYIGSVFYWLMGSCRTKAPRFLSRQDIKNEEAVINAAESAGGVEYSDCYLPGNDARFVFGFIRSAIESGAAVANYVEALGSVRHQTGQGYWATELRDNLNGRSVVLKSKAIINACGAYVDTYNQLIGQVTLHRHVFSKGVHLIVKQLTPHNRILAFFASDGRLFFVIPMGNLTCIGTTDTPVEKAAVEVTDDDRHFILNNANQLLTLEKPLALEDIIAERCGVRPLAVKRGKNSSADWLKLSRKHAIHTNYASSYISIFGGKITDCINVGNELVGLCEKLGVIKDESTEKWYGEPTEEQKQKFLKVAAELVPLTAFSDNEAHLTNCQPNGVNADVNQDESIVERWWRRFGNQAYQLLDDVKQDDRALLQPIVELDYCRCEIALMGRQELVVKLDDFLRRRTKIALTLRSQDLLNHPGLVEVAELLFGKDLAEQKLSEYKQLITGEQSHKLAKAVGV